MAHYTAWLLVNWLWEKQKTLRMRSSILCRYQINQSMYILQLLQHLYSTTHLHVYFYALCGVHVSFLNSAQGFFRWPYFLSNRSVLRGCSPVEENLLACCFSQICNTASIVQRFLTAAISHISSASIMFECWHNLAKLTNQILVYRKRFTHKWTVHTLLFFP